MVAAVGRLTAGVHAEAGGLPVSLHIAADR